MQHAPDHFGFCWGSPLRTMFSQARTTGGQWDLEGVTALVARTLLIFEHFACPLALEYPQTGLLRRQPLMQGPPFTDVSYCKCNAMTHPYEKATRLWRSLGSAF